MERRLSTTAGEERAAGPAKRRPVAMLTHSYYDEDPRVRREAESLVAAGRPVDVYALRRPDDPPRSEVDGVSVRRLDVQRHQGAGLGTYLREYLALPRPCRLGRHRGSPPPPLRARPGPHAARLPDGRDAAAPTDPGPGAARPARGDAGVLPEPFPARREPARLPAAADPGARVDRRWRARSSRSTRRCASGSSGSVCRRTRCTVVANSPIARALRPLGATRRARSRPTATLRLVYAGALTPTYELDVVLEALAIARGERVRSSTSASTCTAAAMPRSALVDHAAPARPRRPRDVPRPDPDRGRASGGRRGRTSASPRRAATRSPT